MTDEDDVTKSVHAWQSFRDRDRCVELAIKCGANPENVVDTAKRIAKYIFLASENETKKKDGEE